MLPLYALNLSPLTLLTMSHHVATTDPTSVLTAAAPHPAVPDDSYGGNERVIVSSFTCSVAGPGPGNWFHLKGYSSCTRSSECEPVLPSGKALLRLVSGLSRFDTPVRIFLLFKSCGLWTLVFVSRFGLAVRR